MKVLVVQPDADAPLGLIGPVFERMGIEVQTWFPRDEVQPAGPWRAVIVLGSETNPDEDSYEPWIGAVRGEVRGALALGLPVMGICFGAQIVAQESGGKVVRMSRPEIGWVPIQPAAGGADDPLFEAMPLDGTRMLAWHRYRIEPPKGAVRLAQKTECEQAFRLADAPVWAVQFHFEADAQIAAAWIDDSIEQLSAMDLDAAALRAAGHEFSAAAEPVSVAIAEGFGSVVLAQS
jgi:GMP synthase (glutamine-hydrolysing)